MVVGEVAVHISNVLTGHFFDDQSPIVGDKEATITTFTFMWGASGKRYLGTHHRLEVLTKLHDSGKSLHHAHRLLSFPFMQKYKSRHKGHLFESGQNSR